MTLPLLRLLFDFGLLVLIWIIQLVVYPGFNYYRKEELLEYHHRYTVQISYIVFPLMLGQLIVTGIQLWIELSWYTLGSLVLIILLWGLTFLQFLPLHNKISRGDNNEKIVVKLARKNWFRTVLWTALFFMSLAFNI